MDVDRFDALTRALTIAGSRRRTLALVLSGALAPLLGREETEAHNLLKKCKKMSGKRKKRCVKKAKAHNAEHAALAPPGPTCTDNIKNGSESDVDCGGTCQRCDIGDACASRDDCASALCDGGVCESCTSHQQCGVASDGVQCACDHLTKKLCYKIEPANSEGHDSCAPCEAAGLLCRGLHSFYCYERCS